MQLTDAGLRVTINIAMVAAGTQVKEAIALSHFVPMTMKRRGVELRLILDGRADEYRGVDAVLLKALARAHVLVRRASLRQSRFGDSAPRETEEALRRAPDQACIRRAADG